MVNIEILNSEGTIENDLNQNLDDILDELLLKEITKEIIRGELELTNEEIENYNFEISLSYVLSEEIRELNREYRAVDKVTDVLSFPQYENIRELKNNFKVAKELFLGDVVICLEVAKLQAKEYGHRLLREFLYLYVHSILHLMGYDHINEDDKKIMREKEEIYMNMFNITR